MHRGMGSLRSPSINPYSNNRRVKKPEEEWQRIDLYILHLYPTMKLSAMKAKLFCDHNFSASSRQYTHRIEKLRIKKYNTESTKAKEYAVNPHTLFDIPDIELFHAGEFLITIGHPAALSLMIKFLNPYLSNSDHEPPIHTLRNQQQYRIFHASTVSHLPLQGFGMAVQHLGVSVAIACAYDTAHTRRTIGTNGSLPPSSSSSSSSSFWDRLINSIHDAQEHLPPITIKLLQTLIANGTPMPLSPSSLDSTGLRVHGVEEPLYGTIDLMTYVLVNNMLVTTSSTSSTSSHDSSLSSLTRLTRDLLAAQPLITQGPDESINPHRQIIDSCLQWATNVLEIFSNRPDLWDLPVSISSLLTSHQSIPANKAALFCILWDFWYRREITRANKKKSSSSSSPTRPKKAMKRRQQAVDAMDAARRNTSTLEPGVSDEPPQRASVSPNWAHGSHYYLGIPPCMFLHIVIDLCFLENLQREARDMPPVASENTPTAVVNMQKALKQLLDGKLTVSEIWEEFIDCAMNRMIPQKNRMDQDMEFMEALGGYINHVVPQAQVS